jgi:hypothetical protein
VPDHLLGKKVRCPSCREIFIGGAVEEELPMAPLVDEAPPVPRRQPARTGEDFEEQPVVARRRVSRPPESEYEEGQIEERRPRRRAVYEDDENEELAGSPRGLSNDYRIDFGEWFQHAKDNYSAVLGPMIGFTLIMGVIMWLLNIVGIFIPFIGPLLAPFIQAPLQVGYTVVCLAQLKGKRWSFGDFFSGFRWYGSLLANWLLTMMIGGVLIIPSVIVFLILGFSGIILKSPGLLVLGIVVAIVNAAADIYILVRMSCFNVPLIIDRNYGPIEAIQGSWTVSRGHFWGLFGCYLLFSIIGGLGALACGIGVLFTLPLFHVGTTAGYLLIAGTRRPRRRRVLYQAEEG